MAESWFDLDQSSQIEALEVVADKTGRPAHLLEKDVWVVWALSAIYGSSLAEKLTFKGGTSLSKVYKIIDRFSEDVDMTYDIRELVSDLLRDGNPIPVNPSQEKKITSAVKDRLPWWINSDVIPVIQAALDKSKIEASLAIEGSENEKLVIKYPALKTGTGYSEANIKLEFGARATGEPNQIHDVGCDMSPLIEGVIFPSARPLVMTAERTFWEKATAAHVYCLQHKIRGERYSRHWYDLAAIAESDYYESAINDKDLAKAVAEHKSMFFSEKDALGAKIDYDKATSGELHLVPSGESLAALERDYVAMLEDGLLTLSHSSPFKDVIEKCRSIESQVNHSVRSGYHI